MMRILALLAFLLWGHSPAQAQEASFSGVELYKMCVSKYDTDYGYCAGYVSAVANLLQTESIAGYRACNLSMIRSQQYIDLFKSYAENVSTELNGEAGAAVAAALARAFPCR